MDHFSEGRCGECEQIIRNMFACAEKIKPKNWRVRKIMRENIAETVRVISWRAVVVSVKKLYKMLSNLGLRAQALQQIQNIKTRGSEKCLKQATGQKIAFVILTKNDDMLPNPWFRAHASQKIRNSKNHVSLKHHVQAPDPYTCFVLKRRF